MRYLRQIAIPRIGETGQAKISRARVLCVGVGGLGSASAQYLAAAGIAKLGLVDHDRVEETNLHRQILYTQADIGRLKVEAAAEKLSAINAAMEIESFGRRFDSDLAGILSGFDIVIEGSDDFATKLTVSDACAGKRIHSIIASASGLDGMVAVLPGGKPGCLRCAFGERASDGAASCDGGGILGAVTGTIGSLQALEALKLIVSGSGEPRLHSFDGDTGAVRSFKISPRPGCVGCPGNVAAASIAPIEISAAAALKARSRGAVFLDVREPDERMPGTADHSRSFPLSRIMSGELPDLPKGTEIVLLCAVGSKSRTACRILTRAGFTRAVSLTGGVLAYEAAISESAPSR